MMNHEQISPLRIQPWAHGVMAICILFHPGAPRAADCNGNRIEDCLDLLPG